MKKEPLPLIYYWIRGAIGKQFVIKQYKSGPVKTRYPDMTRIIASAAQRKCRDLFKEAVGYAQTVMADPEKKKLWQQRVRHKCYVFNQIIRWYMLEVKRAIVNRQQATARLIRKCFVVKAAITRPGNDNVSNNPVAGDVLKPEVFSAPG